MRIRLGDEFCTGLKARWNQAREGGETKGKKGFILQFFLYRGREDQKRECALLAAPFGYLARLLSWL